MKNTAGVEQEDKIVKVQKKDRDSHDQCNLADSFINLKDKLQFMLNLSLPLFILC